MTDETAGGTGRPLIENSGLLLNLQEIPVPPLPKRGGGPGWGSAIAVRSDPTQLFWTRPYGLSPKPWSRLDLASGELRTTAARSGLHGDLRAAVIPDRGSSGWLLLSHALVRVDLDAMTETAVLRSGWPRYLSRLHDLGGGLLAATGWSGSTITLTDARTLSIVGTRRTPSPDAVLQERGGTPVLLAFNAQTARSFDPVRLRFLAQRALPLGKGPFVADGSRVWFVEGARRVDPRAPSMRFVDGHTVAELDWESGEIVRRSASLPEPEAVVGLDHTGRPLVRLRAGLAILDARSLDPVARLGQRSGARLGTLEGSVVMLPDRRSAAVLPNISMPERLWLVRW